MFSKVLIANRGEIAVRVARTCRELGVAVVAVHSDVDSRARFVAMADEAVPLPGVAPADTYLNVEAIVDAAGRSGAEAIHPGYGFLSERAEAAESIAAAGLVWIGPPPEAIRAAGDKVRARRLAQEAGVDPVPGTADPVGDVEEILAFGERHGYPIAIKAAGGGGGRGLKVARDPGDVPGALESAVREATDYFGYGAVYLERYLSQPKHVEVQILAPAPGEATWLGARDCSLQRRHQKLVEETPPPRFENVAAMGEAGVKVANACGYVNAGTVEFLVDPADGRFYFLEVNARLQVEHTITEEVLGIDLVAAQLRIASGDQIDLGGEDVRQRGHAIECRINAEDPARGFIPTPGRLSRYREPGGPGIRVDSGFAEGDQIPPAYDSLIAKVITWGPTRERARRRMIRALGEFDIQGVATTIGAHLLLMQDPAFVDGSYSTATVEGGALASLMSDAVPGAASPPPVAILTVAGTPVRLWNPAVAGSIGGADSGLGGSDSRTVVAPMHGTILKILVAEGDAVERGDPVALLEAMKMETYVSAAAAGTVRAITVAPGAIVEAGQVVANLG
jgi:acetyl-CoA/propionyl-CoA carboxylase, biotin carboxylase, biotin carboxyl carrier protein